MRVRRACDPAIKCYGLIYLSSLHDAGVMMYNRKIIRASWLEDVYAGLAQLVERYLAKV